MELQKLYKTLGMINMGRKSRKVLYDETKKKAIVLKNKKKSDDFLDPSNALDISNPMNMLNPLSPFNPW